jgi:hypothetical protein
MSVTAVDGNSAGLSRLLQAFARQAQSATATGGQAGADADGDNDGTKVAGQKKGHHHGGGGLLKKIESAVSSALQSSADGTDPNKVITDAISSLFQNGAGSTTGTTSDGASTPATASASGTAQNDPRQAFFSLLQQHGVDPQQFLTDLKTALQSAQGSVDLTQAFRGFPPGTGVDSVA